MKQTNQTIRYKKEKCISQFILFKAIFLNYISQEKKRDRRNVYNPDWVSDQQVHKGALLLKIHNKVCGVFLSGHVVVVVVVKVVDRVLAAQRSAVVVTIHNESDLPFVSLGRGRGGVDIIWPQFF